MIRSLLDAKQEIQSLPRMRGDDPGTVQAGGTVSGFAPHARG